MQSKKRPVYCIAFSIQIILCVISLLQTCNTCSKSNIISISGLTFYSALLILAFMRRNEWVSWATAFAFFVHLGFISSMIRTGSLCYICCLAAANITILCIWNLLTDECSMKNLATRGVCGFLIAIVVLTLFNPKLSAVPQRYTEAPESDLKEAKAHIYIFEDDGCPHCQRLKYEIMPLVQKRFTDKIKLEYVNGRGMDEISAFPTILIARGKANELIEGVPPKEFLITKIEGILN